MLEQLQADRVYAALQQALMVKEPHQVLTVSEHTLEKLDVSQPQSPK